MDKDCSPTMDAVIQARKHFEAKLRNYENERQKCINLDPTAWNDDNTVKINCIEEINQAFDNKEKARADYRNRT